MDQCDGNAKEERLFPLFLYLTKTTNIEIMLQMALLDVEPKAVSILCPLHLIHQFGFALYIKTVKIRVLNVGCKM